jgi:hypothetical protein
VAKKKKKKKTSTRANGSGAPAAITDAGADGTTVPRANVGTAVQAAISFNGASEVTATATDETRDEFQVSWT